MILQVYSSKKGPLKIQGQWFKTEAKCITEIAKLQLISNSTGEQSLKEKSQKTLKETTLSMGVKIFHVIN